MRPAVSGLVALLLVAGCSSSEGAPQTLPPAPPVTETPAPAPTASPIPLPPEAQAADAAGAAAFARYYFDVLNEAYATADSSRLQPLARPSCMTCAGSVEAVDGFRRDGERYVGTYIIVRDAAGPAVVPGAPVSVDLDLEQPERRILDAGGRLVEAFPPEPSAGFTMFLERAEPGWVVLAIAPAPDPVA